MMQIRERIIILGAGVMQGPAIRIAGELGFFTVAVDGSAEAPCRGLADRFERIDLADREAVEDLARGMRGEGGLAGVMTAGTDFSTTVAWVAQRLGLPGIPHETALDATDKGRMRARFGAAGLPSPAFAVATSPDLPTDQLPAPFPLVVKPVDSMGARGCRRVDGPDDLRAALADALRFSRSGRAIVEAFMEGPEFSIDAIVRGEEITICGVADRHVFFPPFFIEMGHTMPTAASPRDLAAVLDAFRDGVRALGIAAPGNVGAAKGDVKLTPAGPMLGEIAARLSGGYMSGWTYPYSSGVEPIRAAILLAAGRNPGDLSPAARRTSAERAFVSIPGTVRSVSGVAEARGIEGVRDVFLRVGEGSRVDFPENNVSKCGNVISAAADRASAVESAEAAARAVLIRLDPADGRTADFLRGAAEGRVFPPPAFALGLRDLLEAIPETRIVPGGKGPVRLAPFPALTESGLTDYADRGVAEALAAVRALTGMALPETGPQGLAEPAGMCDNEGMFLGRSFWAAFAAGSYQGAVCYIDGLSGLPGGAG